MSVDTTLRHRARTPSVGRMERKKVIRLVIPKDSSRA